MRVNLSQTVCIANGVISQGLDCRDRSQPDRAKRAAQTNTNLPDSGSGTNRARTSTSTSGKTNRY